MLSTRILDIQNKIKVSTRINKHVVVLSLKITFCYEEILWVISIGRKIY